jgi:5-methylcytosine-specific restriction endonuclease McrA
MKKQLRKDVFEKYGGLCAYCGKKLDDDWQVDHICPISQWYNIERFSHLNDFDNLLPCFKIINHYKRAKDLDQFREYMMIFHLKISKLPKNTRVERTKKRKEYMLRIAYLFDITPEKPFCGKFYFEKIR